ncbi:MAG: cation transporter [Clostridia bacterium]|nr:cation transporter [Clostridia bacterium]
MEEQDKLVQREKSIIKTSFVGIGGNVLLVAGKIVVGVLARSVSIITDAVNNLTDALSSIVTIIGTKVANKRPDKKHPYGHGRVEFITSAIIAMIIFIAGALAIYESITSLVNHDEPEYSLYSFIVIAIAIAVKIFLGVFFRIRGKKLNSDVLKASGLDALLDVLLTVGTLVGAIVSYTTGVHLEGYIGIAIGLFILKTAIDVFREAASKIVGERTDKEFVENMTKDLLETPGVYGVYDLIINNYGIDRNIASVHVEVDDNMTAKEIQRLEREIAYMCFEKYHTIMTVGVYAKHEETEESRHIKSVIDEVVGGFPEVIQTHGFFVDEDTKTVNFDMIVTIDCTDERKIYKQVHDKLHEVLPDYHIHIVLDRDFTLS